MGCVNAAIAAMKANGTLAALQQKWLGIYTSVPVIQALKVVSLDTDATPSDETPNFFAPRHRRIFVGRRGVVASTLSSVLIVGG